MSKPREWWITFQPYAINPLGPCINILKYVADFAHEYGVHVIEYSAFEAMRHERDLLKIELDSSPSFEAYEQMRKERDDLRDKFDAAKAELQDNECVLSGMEETALKNSNYDDWQINKLTTELTAAREKLALAVSFLGHKENCRVLRMDTANCTCGFLDTLEKLK